MPDISSCQTCEEGWNDGYCGSLISLEKPGRLEERHEGGGGKKARKYATPLEQAVQ